jgi:hypothetical protein
VSLKRNFDFRIASGHGCIHGGNHAVDVAVDGRPLRIAEYNDGDSPAFQVLLVLDIFVRGKQKVEPRFLGLPSAIRRSPGYPSLLPRLLQPYDREANGKCFAVYRGQRE